ncbi:MAG: SPASM domain-containing protein [Rhodospirillales bacterium]|nr:SPASM domain-containing protein [Rhodospirillales bacterium]
MALAMEDNFRLTRYHIALGGTVVGQQNSVFVFLTRYGTVHKISKSLYSHIREGPFSGEIIRSELTELTKAGILIPISRDEISDVVSENQDVTNRSKELYIVIQPSSFCQFACDYCGQTHAKTVTSPETIGEIEAWIYDRITTGRYRHVKIGWFGAEPLTGVHQIRLIAERVRDLCMNFDISLTSKIVTNGLALSRGRIEALRSSAHLSEIEVTLDGPPSFHIQRRSPNLKSDTFWPIIENLKLAASIGGMKIVIRCNVDRDNHAAVTDLIDLLSKEGFADFATMYFAPVHSWGNDAHKASLSPEAFAYLDLSWKIRLWEMGWAISFLPKRRHVICIAVRPDGYVIDPSGNVYGCTEMPLVPGYADRKLGDAKDLQAASLRIGDYRHFMSLIVNGKVPCHDCFALPVCGGACPKEWAEGRAPCPPLKYSAPDVLRSWLLTENSGKLDKDRMQ